MMKWQVPVKSAFSVLYGTRKPMFAVQNGMKATTSLILRIFLDLISFANLLSLIAMLSSYSRSIYFSFLTI